MFKRLERHRYQAFLQEHLPSTSPEVLGRVFLQHFFPGHDDVDISEEVNLHTLTCRIEERYVQCT